MRFTITFILLFTSAIGIYSFDNEQANAVAVHSSDGHDSALDTKEM